MDKVQVDYFSPKDVSYSFVFPDGISEFIFRKLTEGDRAKIQNMRSQIEVDRATQVMRMDASSGTVKMEVIELALVEWNLQTKNTDGVMSRLPFESSRIRQLLRGLDPELIDTIYAVIEQHNKWLGKTSESVEELKKKMSLLEQEINDKESDEKNV
jgi:hypothetical protein